MAKKRFNLADYDTREMSKMDALPRKRLEYVPLNQIRPDPENFYSTDGLETLADNILTGSNAAQKRFDDLIDTLRQDAAFDYVLVDCPPSFTAASVAALVNADTVILPTRADAFSRRGALELIEQLRGVARASYQESRFRLLLTMADRSNLAKQAEALLRDSAGLSVCRTVIRSGVAVGESSYARQPLYQYAPRSGVARDYEALLCEVLEWEAEGGVSDGEKTL